MRKDFNKIWSDDNENKYEIYLETKGMYYSEISKYNINDEIIYNIINRISKSYTDSKYEEYKYCGKILLNTLFDINKRNFIENIKIKPKNNSYLFKDSNGDIELYGERFRKKI